MSDFDVSRDDMAQYRLSDTDIDALIDGEPVEGAPAQLTELMASLSAHAELGSSVPVSAALSEFIVTATTGATQPITTSAGAEVVSLHRHRISRLAKAASVVGLAPLPFLIGATMAAAAAVGGAHVAGIVDVPLLPDRGAQIEVVAPPEPDPVVVPSISENEPTDAVAVPPTPARTILPVPSSLPVSAPQLPLAPDVSASAGDHATPSTLPSEAAVEGAPACELGQDTADTRIGQPVEPNTPTPDVVLVPEIDLPVDPCEQAASTTPPIVPSNDHIPSDVTIPPAGQQPDVPPAPVTSPPENIGSPRTP